MKTIHWYLKSDEEDFDMVLSEDVQYHLSENAEPTKDFIDGLNEILSEHYDRHVVVDDVENFDYGYIRRVIYTVFQPNGDDDIRELECRYVTLY